jgi:cell division protein FtsB
VLRSILRLLAAVAALAGLAAYATIMLRGPQGLTALQEKRQQIRALQERNANLTRDIAAKKQRIERLKNDPSLQEVEIEQRTGMVHQGDTKFKIPAPNGRP